MTRAARRRVIFKLATVALLITILGWAYFTITPLPGQFPVYVEAPAGCRVIGEDMIAFTKNDFFARPGKHQVNVDCGGTLYSVTVNVRRGTNHAHWMRGKEKMWVEVD